MSLKRTLTAINFIYFIAGCSAIGVSLFFLATPNKRRQAIIGSDQLQVSLSIGVLMLCASIFFLLGIHTQKFRRNALRIFNVLTLIILLITLGLGAYAWFQTLNIQDSYSDRWRTWPKYLRILFQEEGHCCGYNSVTDYPVLFGNCSRSALKSSFVGCEKSMYQFIIGYLAQIYTALFLFTCINFVSLMGSLVLSKALADQLRYEKSMRKMINLHNLKHNSTYTASTQDHSIAAIRHSHRPQSSALPQNFTRSSIIYSSKQV